MTLTFGSLFAGIGGFDLGLERAGMQCKWQVEIDEYCKRVLTKHWPDVPKFRDIRECGAHNLPTVDLICGGFPCQPFSVAGKQQGATDDRFLWPEMLRIIKEIRPTWVVGENVPGIIRMELDRVLSDLESLGYSTRTFVVPACAVGARHIRSRVFIISNTDSQRFKDSSGMSRQAKKERGKIPVAYPDSKSVERATKSRAERFFRQTEPNVGRVVHGVSAGLDARSRLKSLGNAVVPQIVEFIGKQILEFKRRTM